MEKSGSEIVDFLNNLDIPKFYEEQSNFCEIVSTEEDLYNLLKKHAK